MQRIQAWKRVVEPGEAAPADRRQVLDQYLPDDVWLSYADRAYDEFGNVARSAHSIYFPFLNDHGIREPRSFHFASDRDALFAPAGRAEPCGSTRPIWSGQELAGGLQIGLWGYAASGAFLGLGYFDLFYAYVT
ncbi:MAG: hypothetical protein U1F45_08940 [Burkholderiales bacterium]